MEQILWTFQDAVENLLDHYDLPGTTRDTRRCRLAVIQAYEDLAYYAPWNIYETEYQIKTEASQTGTFTYDHTGGANERQVTRVTGDSFPSNAQYFRFKVGNIPYQIASYVDGDTLTLSLNSNPGADVATATDFTLYRDAYPLPIRFRSIDSLFYLDGQYQIPLLTGKSQFAQQIFTFDSPGVPWYAAIRNANEYYAQLELIFNPPPDDVYTYSFLHKAPPRPLEVQKYATGTVSITSGLLNVTGSGTVFPANCAGSVIRFSADGTNEPTSVLGNRAGVDNPYYAQRVIQTRNSDTSLTVDATVATTLSSVKYTISDPLDIEPGAMYDALLRLSEYKLAVNDQRARDWQEKFAIAHQAIRFAMEKDNRTGPTRGPQWGNWFTRIGVGTDDT